MPILDDILIYKKELSKNKREFYDSLKKNLDKSSYTRYRLFKNVISAPHKLNLIAEVKKASPSRGLIRPNFDLNEIVKVYIDYEVAAISVLTEDKFFQGKPEYIKEIVDNYNVPVLTKDFIIDEGQLYEARYMGASAILLIAGILNDDELRHLLEVANYLDLDSLVEVHNEKELERALATGVEIIGVNNRNLQTLEVDLKVCEELIPKIPKGKVIVAESGVKTHADIIKLQAIGANAVLIGEAFMEVPDIGRKIQELFYGES